MDVPEKVKAVGLSDYYVKLQESDRIKLNRYVPNVKSEDGFHFFADVIDLALADENYRFAVKMCEDSYTIELDDIMEFDIIEKLIQAYIGCGRYDDAKAACNRNLELFQNHKDEILKRYNGNIEDLHFRNNYIDIIVGIDSNYELAEQMLVKYNQMGILSDEDLAYRRNSLKIHRLQKVFDGVYSYRPKGE